jgi:tetratricopeptide (TPR) repeat protein
VSKVWRILVLWALSACAVCFPVVLEGQNPNQLGKIIGQIKVSRADFPNVPVLITLEFRGSPIESAYCDQQGRFGFYNLIANQYRVSVNDDAYSPVGENVNVNPAISPMNIVQLTLIPREFKKSEDPAKRVVGNNPYLIDPAEYYRRFPKKTLKEYEKGVEAEKQGKTDDAIEHYGRAISNSPTFYPAHNNLGTAYLSRQDFPEARSQFEAAIQANQNDGQAHFNLANVMLLTGHYDQATLEIEEGLKREPNSAFGHFLRGLLYSRTNRPELAEKELLATVDLDHTMSQAYLQLVNLYVQQKRTADAISELETYLKAFPVSPFTPKARDLLKRLQGTASAESR